MKMAAFYARKIIYVSHEVLPIIVQVRLLRTCNSNIFRFPVDNDQQILAAMDLNAMNGVNRVAGLGFLNFELILLRIDDLLHIRICLVVLEHSQFQALLLYDRTVTFG